MIDYKNTSLVNQVFAALEKSILSGTYPPGTLLDKEELSTAFSAGALPIGIALDRLEGERLVRKTEDGYLVLGLTIKDVKEMFKVKRLLEPISSRLAAVNISNEMLAKMNDIINQQTVAAEKENMDQFLKLDTQFHEIMYAQSGSPTYESVLVPIHNKLSKYRRASIEASDRCRQVIAEHRAIYEAFETHDPDMVEALVMVHLNKSYGNIMMEVE